MYTIYLDSQTSMQTTDKQVALTWINKGYKFEYKPKNIDYIYWQLLESA